MCGIAGIWAFDEIGKQRFHQFGDAMIAIGKRGPDGAGVYHNNNLCLGHQRLSIIDTSSLASQPLHDYNNNFVIIFNGEIYNYKELKNDLLQKGYKFRSESDTEVLLNTYIEYKEECLNKLNGFFAFAIYDKKLNHLFIAKDRYGIKPLWFFNDESSFIFASELKSILKFNIKKEIDYTSVNNYFRFNYIPGKESIYKNIFKLEPGHYLEIKNNIISKSKYYEISKSNIIPSKDNYLKAQEEITKLLENSVKRRLISDVPLGAFLSGGIDSSIVVAIASKYKDNLNTFSIGYKDNPYFDETEYAQLVAKKFNTKHHVFSLSMDDIFSKLHNILDYFDEPFADSSALAVNILSSEVKKHVTVALSGDGADELFSGYYKHAAEHRIRNKNLQNIFIKNSSFLWKNLPQSRNSSIGNKIRQINKFSRGLNLNAKDRYWDWCSISSSDYVDSLLLNNGNLDEFNIRKDLLLSEIDENDFNSILRTDLKMVLPYDMLTKVDLMSMENSLEVRVPFLDHHLVNYVNSLPAEFKINKTMKKRILQDTFKNILPIELYNRSKKGFEVPLLEWFRTDLKALILDDLLNDKFIKDQGIFNPIAINKIKNKLFSSNPEDIAAQIWALIVFQNWWFKNN